MEQILDVDAGQPPYVELFTHHPLMFMSLGNHRMACKQATPKDLLFWSHSVQCKIDDVAAALGLYKIRMLGPCCMFASTPEMPAKQQAGVMFTAAKRLSSILAEASLPGGDALATQITIHAGKYAGGVVGKGSWTYEVFGSDVQDLLDMDRCCSPNSIQVSDPVLSLLGLETAQFAPSCKLLCGGHEVLLHRWLGQAADAPPGMQAGTAAAAAAAARKGAQHDLPVAHLSPDDQRAAMQQQQQFGQLTPSAYGLSSGSKHAKQHAWLDSEGERSASSAMQPNLQFKDAELEGRYVASQVEQWAHMDGVFVAVTLLLLVAAAYGSSAQGLQQQLLLSVGHWLVPAVAGCWMLLQPRSYCRRREAVWAVHRVLAAAHTAGVIGLVMLQQRWQLPGAAAGMAAAGAAAEGLLRMQQSAAGMLRRRALAMLVESLGFKVRFKTHLLTLTLNVAATTLGVLWQCWSGAAAPATAAAAAAGSPGPWLWELLLQLCVGCVAPTVLLYFWEADEIAASVGGSAPGSRRCSVDEPAEYDDACGAAMLGKAKAL
uniref:Guanylate cyclase domain-containing protein n=1 Tax=Tetradesmus obliquus TaxID=3088 RepID=A0A383VJ83_TETOB|eukprot:jgi/Sobl393_1/10802/SZX65003.1